VKWRRRDWQLIVLPRRPDEKQKRLLPARAGFMGRVRGAPGPKPPTNRGSPTKPLNF